MKMPITFARKQVLVALLQKHILLFKKEGHLEVMDLEGVIWE